jgi:2-polyprenyl-6-methoxyphenol hydroxylase-like FAD-dependent oxidoreductase
MSGIMLKHHGYTVTILEKQDLVARSGFDAGLSIRDEVLAFLAKHDRVKRDMLITCPPGSNISLDGKPSAQRGQTMTLTSWALLVHVLRANFDGRVSAAVPVAPGSREGDGRGTYISNALVLGLKDVGEKVEVVYEDGGGRNMELVADIAESKRDRKTTLLAWLA